jgi:hypothetical protein
MKPVVLVAVLSSLVPTAPLAAPLDRPPLTAADAPYAREPLHVLVARAVFPRERWERLVARASLEATQELTVAARGQLVLDPDFADRLREEYERMAPYEELIDDQARILWRHYTPDELQQLLGFYGSPLGQKSVLLINDLTNYSNQQMQRKVHAGIGAALARLRPLVHPAPGGASVDDDAAAAADSDQAGPSTAAADPEAREL